VSTSDSSFMRGVLYTLWSLGAAVEHNFLLSLFVGFFAGKKVCHFMSVFLIIRMAFSKHRKKGFYLIFLPSSP